MKINLLCIGKTDDKAIKNLINYYLTRLPRHWNFEITEIPDVKNARNLTPDLLKKEEAKLFLNQIENTDLVVLLDEKGKQFTSREFAQKLDSYQNNSIKKICFLVGGACEPECPNNAIDRKSTRLNSSHSRASRMPSSA